MLTDCGRFINGVCFLSNHVINAVPGTHSSQHLLTYVAALLRMYEVAKPGFQGIDFLGDFVSIERYLMLNPMLGPCFLVP